MDIESVDYVLATTRAVRLGLDLSRPVEREVILECLRLAVQAPTASNDQNWRWIVVTDAGKRAAIAEIYRSVGEEYLKTLSATESDPQTRKVYQSAHAFTGILAQVPVFVIPCIERRIDSADLLIAASAWASIIPAAWSFLLALRSRVSARFGRRCIWVKGSEAWQAAWHPGHGHAGGAVSGGVHDRHRLQARGPSAC